MLKIKHQLLKLKFDRKAYGADLERVAEQLMQEVAFIFLETAIHSVTHHGTRYNPQGITQSFPVETGMAKASFGPLAEWIQSKGYPKIFDVKPVRKPDRTAEGAALGKHPKFITERRNQYGLNGIEFTWWTDVPHFVILEDQPHPSPKVTWAPWHATQKGYEAADKWLTLAMPARLPQVSSYIKFVGRA